MALFEKPGLTECTRDTFSEMKGNIFTSFPGYLEFTVISTAAKRKVFSLDPWLILSFTSRNFLPLSGYGVGFVPLETQPLMGS